MMNGKDDKSLLDMPGEELTDTIKRLSRYTLAVEFVALGACLPILTGQMNYILIGSAFLMYLGALFMRLCSERRQKKWIVFFGLQLILATVDLLTIILHAVRGAESAVRVLAYISIAFLWIHCVLCFFDYRKNETVPFLRYIGAFIILITVAICYFANQWLAGLHMTIF